MTTEQIAAIRAAQKAENKFKLKQESELNDYHHANLEPLLKTCDHTLPWGDDAFKLDTTMSYNTCIICGSSWSR